MDIQFKNYLEPFTNRSFFIAPRTNIRFLNNTTSHRPLNIIIIIIIVYITFSVYHSNQQDNNKNYLYSWKMDLWPSARDFCCTVAFPIVPLIRIRTFVLSKNIQQMEYISNIPTRDSV